MGETSRGKCLNKILRELQELEEAQALPGQLEEGFAPEVQREQTLKGEFSALCVAEKKSHVQRMWVVGSRVQHRCD